MHWGACWWIGRLAVGQEQPLANGQEQPVVLCAAPGWDVVDVSYSAPEKAAAPGGDAAKGDSCSSGNCAYGCCCQPVWRWTAGVEATYMDVVLRGVQNIGMDAAPRIWLGVENCNGWGGRMRYWQISASEFFVNAALTSSPSPTDVFDQLFDLNLYTIDLEATKRGEFGDWDWLAFLGGRYVGYKNEIVTDISDTTFSNVFVDDIHAQAGGITTGIEASRSIGWGPLAVYGGVRVSPLWGNSDNFHVARFNSTGSPTTQITGTATDLDLTIWEVQVGLQCSKYIACCNGTVFGRVGFEYQAWDFYNNTNQAAVPLHDLDLYGVAVSLGITR